jgi:hypothetical protein
MKSFPPTGYLCAKVVTAFLLTGTLCLGQDNNSNSNNGNDVSALKTQMQKMQKDYGDRISAMEAEMKSFEFTLQVMHDSSLTLMSLELWPLGWALGNICLKSDKESSLRYRQL